MDCRDHISFRFTLIASLMLVLLPAGLVFASGGAETTQVWLEPYRVPKSAWGGPYMAYRLTFQDGESLDWIWGIDGFDDFVWGTRYVLRVRVESIANPPPDTPATRYRLVKVLSSWPAGEDETFSLPLKTWQDVFVEPSETASKAGSVPTAEPAQAEMSLRWSLLGEAEIHFPDEQAVEEFQAALSESSELTGLFRFAGTAQPAVLELMH